jgi:heme A synthase
MLLNHFQALLLFALVVSAAFAFLTKRTSGERFRYALLAFLAFVGVAVAVGWLMFPLSH